MVFTTAEPLCVCHLQYLHRVQTPQHKSRLFHDLMYLTHPAEQNAFDLMNEIRREDLSEGQFRPRKFSNAGR